MEHRNRSERTRDPVNNSACAITFLSAVVASSLVDFMKNRGAELAREVEVKALVVRLAMVTYT